MNQDQVKAAVKKGKKRRKPEVDNGPAPGIAQDRERPLSSGHCGAKNCSHASHR